MALSASSSRWCPTPEQVMILEEIYNKGGIKTPNAFQIQQITNHLSFYGKIEGKNVFYWFQNHKARQRQKLRRKFMQNQKHLQLNQPCWYHYSAAFTPLPQGGRPGADGHRCWPDINGISAGVQRSFHSQLCSLGQPPLKTLELFPLKSTNLNSNANPNKDPTSSSRSSY